MYPQTLYPETRQVLDNIKDLSFMSSFYMAGGTALALQLGHRKSIDLDFFSGDYPKKELFLVELKKYNPKVIQEALGSMDVLIDNVKVSFLEYNYPLIEDLLEFDGVKIASIDDIASMKLSAISSRGSRKDFVDLYIVLQKYSLEDLFEKFEKKFVGVNYQKLIILKSLTYFNDAEDEPDPDYIKDISWPQVKRFIEKNVKEYLQKETI